MRDFDREFLGESMALIEQMLRQKVEIVTHPEHKEFFRGRAELSKSLSEDLRSKHPVDMQYAQEVHDDFVKLVS